MTPRPAAALLAAALLAAVAGVPPHAARGADPIDIAVEARALQPGELVVLDLTLPEPAERVHVMAFGRELPAFAVAPRKWRALVGIDLDVRPGTYEVAARAGALRGAKALAVKSKRFRTRRLTVDEAFVTPPPSAEARILRDVKRLDAVWAAPAPERLWSAPFVRPVPGAANSAFGTRSIFNGKPRSPHGGADFLSPAGTPVHAPSAGRVALAEDLYFSGNTVIIDHGLGLFSLLAHLSVIDVHEGDVVAAGQLVGRVGATGRVTGAHLHWAVRAGGARVDPLSVLALLGSGDSRP
jgi:murein DD-endopeptidase MepM/ murein hydrolase activator NlpD